MSNIDDVIIKAKIILGGSEFGVEWDEGSLGEGLTGGKGEGLSEIVGAVKESMPSSLKLKCAPSRKGPEYEKTCYNLDELKIIAKKLGINISGSKEQIKEKIMETGKFIDEMDMIYTLGDVKRLEVFRPYGPNHKFNWLSNFNIDEFLDQYRKIFPKFYNFRSTYVNFYEFETPEMTPQNIKALYDKGYRTFAIIVNTARYGEEGKHWISLMIKLDPNYTQEILFYDSIGDAPPGDLNDIINDTIKAFPQLKLKLTSCGLRAQYGGSLCGVYAIHFIIYILYNMDEKFADYCKDRRSDNLMEFFRDNIFFTMK